MIPMNQEQAPMTDRYTDDAILTAREPREEPRSSSLLKKQWRQSLSVYCQTLPPLLHLPAAWALAAACLAGCLILVFTGHSGDVLGNLPTWTIMLALTLLALPLTAGAPPAPQESAAARPGKARWGIQVAVLLLVLAFISSLTLLHYKVIQAQIPLMTPLATWLFGSLEKLGQPPTIGDLSIAALSFVLPMALFLLLGARWREVSFGRGYRN